MEIASNPGRKPQIILAADYNTRELISAKDAIWVMGGNKKGGMSKRAKWAFASKAAADSFIKENGGTIADFDTVLKASYEDLYDDTKITQAQAGIEADQHSHMGHQVDYKNPDMSHDHHNMSQMEPGSQMIFNPGFADDIYHVHPKDMWMVNYKFTRTSKRGLRNGTDNIDTNSVSPVGHKPFGYMMTPTNMTMDMQMLMAMYGLTDRITLMATGTYQSMNMDMLMNMGMGNKDDVPMSTSGIGDTELRGIFGINKYFNASLGIGLPTGDIRQIVGLMGRRYRAPYDMQLGSGTLDIKPALTYNALSDNKLWNWGAQAMYISHIKGNNSDYALGDSLRLNTWLQRAFGKASTWLRVVYSDTGRISGYDPEIQKSMAFAPSPDADPNNYGGQELDTLIGASYVKGPFSVGAEFGIPAYQKVNGLQLKSEWIFNIGIQVMF